VTFSGHSFTSVERTAILDIERRGTPFLVYRDAAGDVRFTELADRDRISLGRIAGNDVVIDWDRQVSRAHARLERVGVNWVLVDDGLSRNGSYVNEERVLGSRMLSNGDVVRVGHTTLVFRAPARRFETTLAEPADESVRLTDAERRVLVALCAPFAAEGTDAPAPATNVQIAAELNLSVPGVKSHVRALFTKLGVGDLPQYQKRTELASRALQRGLVTHRDLHRP
jgi:pSer/pThr/pTyr-binding forkhead associated (FHA) protein